MGLSNSEYADDAPKIAINVKSKFYKKILDGKFFIPTGPGNFRHKDPSDPDQEYITNSHGFRSKEFSSKNQLLVAGCSITHGSGVPVEARWGDQLAKKLKMSHSTIAAGGASISWVVENVIAHLEFFGFPKTIVCLFPDAHRFFAPINGTTIKSKNLCISFKDSTGLAFVHIENDSNFNEKYFKIPLPAEKIISSDMCLFQSVRAIRELERYCKLAKIKLVWGTWDQEFNNIVKSLNKTELKFNNFIDVYSKFNYKRKIEKNIAIDSIYPSLRAKNNCTHDKTFGCSCEIAECHLDLKKELGDKVFFCGTDINEGLEHAHPGGHLHAHFAEAFFNNL